MVLLMAGSQSLRAWSNELLAVRCCWCSIRVNRTSVTWRTDACAQSDKNKSPWRSLQVTIKTNLLAELKYQAPWRLTPSVGTSNSCPEITPRFCPLSVALPRPTVRGRVFSQSTSKEATHKQKGYAKQFPVQSCPAQDSTRRIVQSYDAGYATKPENEGALTPARPERNTNHRGRISVHGSTEISACAR